jgi:hypothetical protein
VLRQEGEKKGVTDGMRWQMAMKVLRGKTVEQVKVGWDRTVPTRVGMYPQEDR